MVGPNCRPITRGRISSNKIVVHLDYFYFTVLFVFGLVIGSFLNVCIYRMAREGMSILTPKLSFCPHCKISLKWYHNIPFFSYVFLRGKCAYCSAPISIRYPLVELLTGGLFVFAAYMRVYPFDKLNDFHSIVFFIIALYLISILIIVTFIDFEFRLIPDALTIPSIILALLVSIFFPFIHGKEMFPSLPVFVNGLLSSLAGIAAGGGIIYVVGLIGKLIFRKEAMGEGDIYLMAFLGGFMGWESILYAFFIACVLGSVIGIILYLVTKDHYIAFGPFLGMAALIVFFFKPHIVVFVFQKYPEFFRGLFN